MSGFRRQMTFPVRAVTLGMGVAMPVGLAGVHLFGVGSVGSFVVPMVVAPLLAMYLMWRLQRREAAT